MVCNFCSFTAAFTPEFYCRLKGLLKWTWGWAPIVKTVMFVVWNGIFWCIHNVYNEHMGCLRGRCSSILETNVMSHNTTVFDIYSLYRAVRALSRDCNPGLEFSIPGFGIVEFLIPGSRRDWRQRLKCKIRGGGTPHSTLGPWQWSCAFPQRYNTLRWGNALSHKLEVGERRSLASHYTLTTDWRGIVKTTKIATWVTGL